MSEVDDTQVIRVECVDCGLSYYAANPTDCPDCRGQVADYHNPERIVGDAGDAEEEEYTYYKGHDHTWREERAPVLERDDYQCVICGITDDEHRERDDLWPVGGGLHVHHFEPTRRHELDRMNDAHIGPNLATLCHTHHRDVESGKIETEVVRRKVISNLYSG